MPEKRSRQAGKKLGQISQMLDLAPRLNRPPRVAYRQPIDAGIGDRIVARRVRRQTMHITVNDVEDTAVRDNDELLSGVTFDQAGNAGEDAGFVLAPAFAAG